MFTVTKSLSAPSRNFSFASYSRTKLQICLKRPFEEAFLHFLLKLRKMFNFYQHFYGKKITSDHIIFQHFCRNFSFYQHFYGKIPTCKLCFLKLVSALLRKTTSTFTEILNHHKKYSYVSYQNQMKKFVFYTFESYPMFCGNKKNIRCFTEATSLSKHEKSALLRKLKALLQKKIRPFAEVTLQYFQHLIALYFKKLRVSTFLFLKQLNKKTVLSTKLTIRCFAEGISHEFKES